MRVRSISVFRYVDYGEVSNLVPSKGCSSVLNFLAMNCFNKIGLLLNTLPVFLVVDGSKKFFENGLFLLRHAPAGNHGSCILSPR